MLQEIHIQNYAVIDKLELEFHPGLNLLSGETGSGKSILVDALGLALGGRASADVIRAGQERAIVTAVFRARPPAGARRHPWSYWFEECGLDGTEEPEVVVRREVHTSGKSRVWVNNQPVTIAAVRVLANVLVEVHGQSEQVTLFAREVQLELLDQLAGLERVVKVVGALFARRRELEREMESLSRNEQDRLRAIDLLAFQAQELDRARLQPGEDARLEEEKQVLGNLEKIRAAATGAYGHLYEEEGSANSRLAAAARLLEELGRYDAAFEPYLGPLAGAKVTLEDIAFFLRDYLGKLEANPRRLEEIEDRLALIDRLKRKYGNTVEEILAHHERARHELKGLEHADERRAELEGELAKAAAEYRKAAEALSGKRREAARRLEKLVRVELAQLGMGKTRFEIYFQMRTPDAPAVRLNGTAECGGARGVDEVEFLISPNPGEELRPLEKIASGGELSRLMLALKTVGGRARSSGGGEGDGEEQQPAPSKTFVFDEVDAGIGGRVAECVGQRLKRLAGDTQVLCVTHLAQIACFADHHYYVEKFERDGRTVVEVKCLADGKERAAELARMLSGSKITDAALKHAATMLKQASR